MFIFERMKNFDWSDYAVIACIEEVKHCDMCGTLIKNTYVLKNSTGDTKYLGCECVKKTDIKKITVLMDNKTFSKKSIRNLKKVGIEIDEVIPF
jgi:hypothetical protein